MGTFKFSIGARNTRASATWVSHLLVTGRPILRAVPGRIQFALSPDGRPEGQDFAAIQHVVWAALHVVDARWFLGHDSAN